MNFFHKKTKAFSLIEVLVVLVIIGLMTTFSIIGLQQYQKTRELKLYAKALYHDLKWARIESILLNQPVEISPANHNWCDGWIVAKDGSNNKDDELENKLLKQQAGLANCKIKFSSFPRKNIFRFLPEGITDYQNGSYYFYSNATNNNGNQPNKLLAKIVVSQMGRVRFE